ncbi:myb-like protein AA [Teleopsis dalmanni]|uniref:myb-like protein AA n=1 Tax=Teleopsis dalmanni TaxID=139649 RepID=UPI0018CF430B|nr:myb-like protein AA [Teleopsis dalmanni]
MLHYNRNERYPQLLPKQPHKQLPQENFQQQQQQQQQQQHQLQQQQLQRKIPILRVHYIRINSKDGSSAGNVAKMKTIAPNIRRRRRCDKHHLELYRDAPDVTSVTTASTSSHASVPLTVKSVSATTSAATSPIHDIGIPAPPITPPPAFLSAGYKRGSTSSGATIKRCLGE